MTWLSQRHREAHRQLSPGLVQHALLEAELVDQRWQVPTRPPALRSELLRHGTYAQVNDEQLKARLLPGLDAQASAAAANRSTAVACASHARAPGALSSGKAPAQHVRECSIQGTQQVSPTQRHDLALGGERMHMLGSALGKLLWGSRLDTGATWVLQTLRQVPTPGPESRTLMACLSAARELEGRMSPAP